MIDIFLKVVIIFYKKNIFFLNKRLKLVQKNG